jgi:orotidine-5'-phosphate decarboxylase
MNNMDKVVVALDVDNTKKAIEIVEKCKGYPLFFKIGKQLFTSVGPEIVKKIKNMGHKVFLDLKYHDIPNTVAMATIEAAKLGVDIVNLHISGGREMIETTVSKVEEYCLNNNIDKPEILGVTILTSLDNKALEEIGYKDIASEMVVRLAKLGKDCGLDGVVCSPLEIELVKKACGKEFKTLTPGIRPEFAMLKDDQKRVLTPKKAFELGTDYIVIGRPVTKSEDIPRTLKKLQDEIR